MSSLAMDSPEDVSPHWLARLLGLTQSWRVFWQTPIRGWLFSKLELTSSGKIHYLRGLRAETAQSLAEQINRRRLLAIEKLRDDLMQYLAVLEPLSNGIRVLLSSERYLAALERERLVGWVQQHQTRIKVAQQRMASPHADRFADLTEKLKRFLPALAAFAREPENMLAERNKRFVDQEWKRWEPFFAVCERTPLTEEQGKAAITIEKATLLGAAAGSGKSSTLVGKVAYMLPMGIAVPGEILCMAFNNGAAKEIRERLKERLTFILSDECDLDEGFKEGLKQFLSGEGGGSMKLINSFVIKDEAKSVAMPIIFWVVTFFVIDVRYGFDVERDTPIPGFISIFLSDSLDVEGRIREMSMLGIFSMLLMVFKLKDFSVRASSDIARIMYWMGSCFVTFVCFFKKLVNHNHHGFSFEMIVVGLGLIFEGFVIVLLVDYMGRTRSGWNLRGKAWWATVHVLQFFRMLSSFMLTFLRSIFGSLFRYLKNKMV
jgi:hypothetical protein